MSRWPGRVPCCANDQSLRWFMRVVGHLVCRLPSDVWARGWPLPGEPSVDGGSLGASESHGCLLGRIVSMAAWMMARHVRCC